MAYTLAQLMRHVRRNQIDALEESACDLFGVFNRHDPRCEDIDLDHNGAFGRHFLRAWAGNPDHPVMLQQDELRLLV